MSMGNNKKIQADEQLLRVLTEQMKMPLLQIARTSELALMTKQYRMRLETIELTADTALKLLDNYLLSLKLTQAHAELEPVSVAAVLNDTAHELSRLAANNQCELQVHLSGRYEPIMAHKQGLQAALASLGYVFIEAQHEAGSKEKPALKLAAHRSKNGIVAGMFANFDGLSVDMYRRAKQLYGTARQPLSGMTSGSGAGVFVADSLLDTMSAHLRVAYHQRQSGLAATFMPSRQLSFEEAT